MNDDNKNRKVAAIINGDGPMVLSKATVRALVEERDAARDEVARLADRINALSSEGTFAQGIEAAARVAYRTCAETRHVTLGLAVEKAILALPLPLQADPIREAAQARWWNGEATHAEVSEVSTRHAQEVSRVKKSDPIREAAHVLETALGRAKIDSSILKLFYAGQPAAALRALAQRGE